jgi:hypothetical protein
MHLGLYIPHNSFGMWGFIGIVGLEGATYLTHPKIISSAICTYKSMSQFSSQFSSKLTCHPIPSTCPSIHATRWGALYRTEGEPQGLHLVQRSLASTPQSEREKRERRWRWWLPDSGSDRLALLHRFCFVCLTLPCYFRSTHSSPSPLLLTVENISWNEPLLGLGGGFSFSVCFRSAVCAWIGVLCSGWRLRDMWREVGVLATSL